MKTDVICLYDVNGLSAEKWAEAGYDVYHYDYLTVWERIVPFGKGRKIFKHWDARNDGFTVEIIDRHKGKTAIVLGFPPCDDLAVSGAAHFWAKEQKDEQFQAKAMKLVYRVEEIANALEAPYCIENPVSMISTFWRKPDFRFDPYEYGGYLPENDIHPHYPQYIAARDAYPKKTCYWVGNGFVMPPKKPVYCPPGYSKQYAQLGGKSAKTKRIRSMSPRGIAAAIYEANAKPLP